MTKDDVSAGDAEKLDEVKTTEDCKHISTVLISSNNKYDSMWCRDCGSLREIKVNAEWSIPRSYAKLYEKISLLFSLVEMANRRVVITRFLRNLDDAFSPGGKNHNQQAEHVSILCQKLTAAERRVTELESVLRRERVNASIKYSYSFAEYTRGRLQAQGPINPSTSSRMLLGALGLAGEAGEFTEIVKKHIYHGKLLNKEKAIKELGDILWYVMYSAAVLGSTLEEVALANVLKLDERFPDGWTEEAASQLTDENETDHE